MKIVQIKPLKTVRSAVEKYVEFISPTYGPAGKKILIATNPFQVKAADDGHEASKEFELENELENAVISYVKETTEHINSRVGDGRATAVILMGAIVEGVLEGLDNPLTTKSNYHAEVHEIKKGTEEAIETIKSKAKEVKTKPDLYKVALNSSNDEEIAKLVSDTVFKIGVNGLLSVEDSQSVNTEVEIVEGMELDKGLASPYLMTSEGEGSLNDPYIIIFNKHLDSFNELVPLINVCKTANNGNIVVIAESFSESVLQNLIIARVKGLIAPLAIECPGYGENKAETFKDIALITGGQVIDTTTQKIEDITIEFFGKAKKVTARKNKTTIIGGQGSKIDIAYRVTQLKDSLSEKSRYEKDMIEKRIAVLEGGIALIKVGAVTESEQKSKKGKVSDAVHATRIAFRDGVVKGGGKTYSELKTSSPILNKALQEPLNCLISNGKEFLDDNVTDPAGVLIASLETASSIARGLLSLGGIVTNKRKKEDKEIDF